VASGGGEHPKMIQEHHFHRKIQNNKKVIDFDLFFGHDRDLTPPQYPSWGVLGTACECDFWGVTLQVDLTN